MMLQRAGRLTIACLFDVPVGTLLNGAPGNGHAAETQEPRKI
jgi:hypothetical protein